MSKYLQDLSWSDVRDIDRENTIVLVPCGSTEQHAYHMPLGTDTFIADGVTKSVLEKLGEDFPILVAPTLNIGQSPEHMKYSGTISLRPATLLALVEDVAGSLALHGFKKIVFLNAHGGNTDILKAFSYDLRYRYGAYMFVIDVWGLMTTDLQKPFEQESRKNLDLHAGELETSMVMAIRPDTVHMERAVPSVPKRYENNELLRLVGPVYMGWSSLDVSESGASGEPQYASPEKGEKLLDFLADIAARGIREIKQWKGAIGEK